MNHNAEHIYKSIGWYLNDLLKKCGQNNILFVGRIEYINEDIEQLKQILNIPEHNYPTFLRKNTSIKTDKYLSSLAIKNLINFYKKDYDCLKQLAKMGFLNNTYIKECYSYSK